MPFIIEGKVLLQEQKAAGHIASAIKEQTEMWGGAKKLQVLASVFHFLQQGSTS